MKLPNENSHQVFKTRRVRYARADELELYSSSTTSPVKRRHQLIYVEVLLFLVHALSVDEHKHSPVRMRYSKFEHYVQNYRHRTDAIVVCWLPKPHGFNLAPLFH